MFKSFCDAQGIEHILPVATAVVRDAGNGARFLDEIARTTGLDFRPLSGEEEAFYSTVGVINSLGLFDGIVLDVGGGSAEIGLIRDGAFTKGHPCPSVRTGPPRPISMDRWFQPDKRSDWMRTSTVRWRASAGSRSVVKYQSPA